MSSIIEIVIQGRIIVQGNETRAELARIGIDIEALAPPSTKAAPEAADSNPHVAGDPAAEEPRSKSQMKRLAAQCGEGQLADPDLDPPAPEWPKEDPNTGALLDSRGIPWIEEIHSAGKTCAPSTGEWRKKKGVSLTDVERLERQAMEAGKDPLPEDETDLPQDDVETEPAPPAENQEPAENNQAVTPPTESGGTALVTLEQIEAGIAAAQDRAEIDAWLHEAMDLNVYPETYARLEDAAEKRAQALAAPEDTYDSIRAAIEAAIFPNEITDWLERARNIVITQGQRYALEAVADERRRQLDAMNQAA